MKNEDEVQSLNSKLLSQAGISHGWFMRYGGVSDGLFKSLNGKKAAGDTDKNVEQNRSRAVRSIIPVTSRIEPNKLITHITHSFQNRVLEADMPGEFQNYDASITTRQDIILSQATADCGSLIIADAAGSLAALIHGSWHTLSTKIISDTVAKIKQHTSNDLIAGIGPMICKNCYQYGLEASHIFDKKYLNKVKNKYFVDLKQMVIDQLHKASVTKIDDVNVCTLEDERFFSRRRDGVHSGRFITLAKLSQ